MAQNTMVRWVVRNGRWTFGVSDLDELVKATEAYTMAGIADRITCPTLVLEAENDQFFKGQPERVFDNPKQVIATYNDYRRGDGTCGVTYSRDGGRTWADTTAPNGFVRGTAFGGAPREYFQSGGDASVAWDTRGNAYLSCQEFKRAVSPDADQSSGFYVYRSTGSGGASFNFAGRPVAEHDDTAGAGNFLLDKQLITADNHVRSPYRDRVYVTWTTYPEDGTAYIYEAYSRCCRR